MEGAGSMVIAQKDGMHIRIPEYKSGYYKALGYEIVALDSEPSGKKPAKKDQKKAGSDADAD